MEKQDPATPPKEDPLDRVEAGLGRAFRDRALLEEEYIGVHPCVNTSSLKLRTRDLLEKILPAMGHECTMVALQN